MTKPANTASGRHAVRSLEHIQVKELMALLARVRVGSGSPSRRRRRATA